MVKTPKTQHFSDNEGKADGPLAPLPDDVDVGDGDDDEQDDTAVPTQPHTAEASVAPEEPPFKPASLKPQLSMGQGLDDSDMTMTNDGLDESLKTMQYNMKAGVGVGLDGDDGMMDIALLAPDGLGLEMSHDLSQMDGGDALLVCHSDGRLRCVNCGLRSMDNGTTDAIQGSPIDGPFASTMMQGSRKRLFPLTLASLSAILTYIFVLRDRISIRRSSLGFHSDDSLDSSAWLRGPPTRSFRDNLKNDSKYITSWGSSAGFTNDVITFMNLLYLARITERVPILPVFMSTHLPEGTPPLVLSEAFDLPRLTRALGQPVLEWRDVKVPDSDVVDDLGCWNVWESVQYKEHGPRLSSVPLKLNLDISYTKTPHWVKLVPNFEHDQHSTFWSLAALAFPQARTSYLGTAIPSVLHALSLPPDDHLLCFDFLYYTAALHPFELELDYSPAWRFVGKYMVWTERLEKIADEYVRKALEVEAHEPTPPFISIHARRQDFKDWCGSYTPDECFPSLETIARRVAQVSAELWERKGIRTHQVIVTGDETDLGWWEEVEEYGWKAVDHRRTVEEYGVWYPILIDAVIQSQGAGFVGTDRSTMSALAARRVVSWRDGAVRIVKWGRPGADDENELHT